MAEYLKKYFNSAINIRIELSEDMGYAPVTKLRLSTKKLQSIGWSPKVGNYEMYNRLIDYLKKNDE